MSTPMTARRLVTVASPGATIAFTVFWGLAEQVNNAAAGTGTGDTMPIVVLMAATWIIGSSLAAGAAAVALGARGARRAAAVITIAAVLLVVSLPLTAVSDESIDLTVPGWRALASAQALMAMGQPAWLANPVALVGLLALLHGRRGLAASAGIGAACLAIGTFIFATDQFDFTPGPAFWLWLFAMASPALAATLWVPTPNPQSSSVDGRSSSFGDALGDSSAETRAATSEENPLRARSA